MLARSGIRASRERFLVEGKKTKYNFHDFWKWAYHNIDVPLLRGVLVEYLIVRYLVDNALAIVGDRIKEFTHYCPRGRDLQRSLSPYYSYQPHGDVFDLQLHWGVTIEIKSASSTKGRSLKMTRRWGPLRGYNAESAAFPAQYYILAVVSELTERTKSKTNIPDFKCYICRGARLDANLTGKTSISFNKWVRESEGPFKLVDLPSELKKFQDEDVKELQQNMCEGWKISRPSLKNQVLKTEGKNFIPLALDTDGDIRLSWYDMTCLGQRDELDEITSPWKKDFKPTWRDWEAAGFRYELG